MNQCLYRELCCWFLCSEEGFSWSVCSRQEVTSLPVCLRPHGSHREQVRSPAAADPRAHKELGDRCGVGAERLPGGGRLLCSSRSCYKRPFTCFTLLLPWGQTAQTFEGKARRTRMICASDLQLDEMCITFDEGKTRLNFAEAALLIQGSTSIYSKKVSDVSGCGGADGWCSGHVTCISAVFRWSCCTALCTRL